MYIQAYYKKITTVLRYSTCSLVIFVCNACSQDNEALSVQPNSEHPNLPPDQAASAADPEMQEEDEEQPKDDKTTDTNYVAEKNSENKAKTKMPVTPPPKRSSSKFSCLDQYAGPDC